jgi:hypothetical protein
MKPVEMDGWTYRLLAILIFVVCVGLIGCYITLELMGRTVPQAMEIGIWATASSLVTLFLQKKKEDES